MRSQTRPSTPQSIPGLARGRAAALGRPGDKTSKLLPGRTGSGGLSLGLPSMPIPSMKASIPYGITRDRPRAEPVGDITSFGWAFLHSTCHKKGRVRLRAAAGHGPGRAVRLDDTPGQPVLLSFRPSCLWPCCQPSPSLCSHHGQQGDQTLLFSPGAAPMLCWALYQGLKA